MKKINTQTFTVKENGKNVKYTIEYRDSTLGVSGNFIYVSNGTKDSWLNRKDSTDAGKKAMTQFCASLYNLGKKVTEAKKLIADTLIEDGAKVFSAIFGSGAFKKVSKEYVTDKFETLFDSITDKKIKTAVSQYKTLNTAYKNLETEINSAKCTIKSITSKDTAFTNAAKKVQSSLTYNSNYTEVTIPSNRFGSFKNTTKKIDNSDFTVPVCVNCGSLDDIVIGSGKGNDSLWGGAGNDLFVYNADDGKDFIIGFDNTDLLQIKDTFSASYNKSKKEIYFDVGSTANAITIKNFGSTSNFNINGTNYKISGSNLVK